MKNRIAGLTLVATLVLAGSLLAPRAALAGWWNRDAIRGSGHLVTQERDIDNFTRIELSGSFDLFVQVGEQPSLSITFDDNIIEHIETEVHGRTLEIDCRESFSSSRGCRIAIAVPKLDAIFLSGSGDIVAENIDSDEFRFEVSGSGDFEARGRVKELDISVKGSGDVDARDLIAEYAYVVIKGSGDVDVHATEELDGSIYGSGDITYFGDPKHVSRRVAGSGDINRR